MLTNSNDLIIGILEDAARLHGVNGLDTFSINLSPNSTFVWNWKEIKKPVYREFVDDVITIKFFNETMFPKLEENNLEDYLCSAPDIKQARQWLHILYVNLLLSLASFRVNGNYTNVEEDFHEFEEMFIGMPPTYQWCFQHMWRGYQIPSWNNHHEMYLLDLEIILRAAIEDANQVTLYSIVTENIIGFSSLAELAFFDEENPFAPLVVLKFGHCCYTSTIKNQRAGIQLHHTILPACIHPLHETVSSLSLDIYVCDSSCGLWTMCVGCYQQDRKEHADLLSKISSSSLSLSSSSSSSSSSGTIKFIFFLLY